MLYLRKKFEPVKVHFFKDMHMDCNGKLLDLRKPAIMGILNLTPDSFYDGGRYDHGHTWLARAEEMITQGADIIDIGAVSTRPKAREIPLKEELDRLLTPLRTLRKKFPDTILSVDTYRSEVARTAYREGTDMINDISGGRFDEQMMDTIAILSIPYVIMHIRGTPENMQDNPVYSNVTREVKDFLLGQASLLENKGFHKIILDPGFGFGKTRDHNFTLLKNLREFRKGPYPVMTGISRKSMINRSLGTKPDNALTGTIVLNTIALLNGANILRVHDVKEAYQSVKLTEIYKEA